jgi:hypothetical protein
MPPKDNGLTEEEDDLLYTRRLNLPSHVQSSVPADLVENLSKRERDTLEKLSIMAQRIDWLTDAAMVNNDAARVIEKRLIRTERFKAALMSKWSAIVGVLALVAPYVLPKIFGKLFSTLLP